MTKYSLTRTEREVIINWDEEKQNATIYTSSKQIIRKLDAMVGRFPETYNIIREDNCSRTYGCPKNLVSFRAPRNYSPEQRKALQEKGRRMGLSK